MNPMKVEFGSGISLLVVLHVGFNELVSANVALTKHSNLPKLEH